MSFDYAGTEHFGVIDWLDWLPVDERAELEKRPIRHVYDIVYQLLNGICINYLLIREISGKVT